MARGRVSEGGVTSLAGRRALKIVRAWEETGSFGGLDSLRAFNDLAGELRRAGMTDEISRVYAMRNDWMKRDVLDKTRNVKQLQLVHSEGTTRSIRPYLLAEGMKSPHDLPDDIFVALRFSESKGDQRMIVYYSDAYGRPLTPVNSSIHGRVSAKMRGKVYDNAFEVTYSEATPGWGPMLYDVAIENASLIGGGLMSDRSSVSKEAAGVWNKYLNKRGDIDINPIKIDNPEAHHGSAREMGEEGLRYRYTKLMGMTKRLQELGKFLHMTGNKTLEYV